jgi:hypothetical protein
MAAAPASAASLSPGGRSVVADEAFVSGLAGSTNAPFGLVATVAAEYDLDDNFRWDGDESGVEFIVPFVLPKSNANNALYVPLCNHVVVKALPHPRVPPQPLRPTPVASLSTSIFLSKTLTSIIEQVSCLYPSYNGSLFYRH